MNMNKLKTYHVNVTDCRATYDAKTHGKIVCGNPFEIEFTFDEQWNDYDAKKAKIKFYHEGIYKSLTIKFNGTVCSVPALYNIKQIEVGVFVGNDICTTTGAIIECEKSINCGATKSILGIAIDNITKLPQGIDEKLDALIMAATNNANALQQLRTEYEEALAELQETDENNDTAIQELTEAYNAKVIELEEADAKNNQIIQEHIAACKKVLDEFERICQNSSTTATNAHTIANTAQGTATLASQQANTAQSTANSAVAAANNAQDTANNALDVVNEAYEKVEQTQNDLGKHIVSEEAHNDIRLQLKQFIQRVNTLLDSDEITLDQMSEVVAYIKNNKDLIDGITTSKVNVVDIIDNLTTNVYNKPLSAKQGVALKALVDEVASNLSTKLDANHTEWDYVLVNSTTLATDLKNLSGNVLVKGGSHSSYELDIGTEVKHLRFVGTQFTSPQGITMFKGHCEKISGIKTNSYIGLLGVADEIEDCEFGAVHIANAKVSDIYINGASPSQSTFDGCDYMNNIKIADGSIFGYMNCKHINPYTCMVGRSGVPMINENGSLSFLDSAEGGSYGS